MGRGFRYAMLSPRNYGSDSFRLDRRGDCSLAFRFADNDGERFRFRGVVRSD